MAKSTDQKSGYSIADLISIFGFLILGCFLYLGFSYNGENSGTALLYAIIGALLTGGLAFGLVKLKKVENNFLTWKIVEYVVLGGYAILALVCASPVSSFININSHSAELKEAAQNDFKNYETAIADFKSHSKTELTTTVTGLQNLMKMTETGEPLNVIATSELIDFLRKNEIKISTTNIEKWEEVQTRFIEEAYNTDEKVKYSEAWREAMDKSSEEISKWEFFKIPEALGIMKSFHENLKSQMRATSEAQSKLFVKIDKKKSSKYGIIEKGEVYEPEGVQTSQFVEKFEEYTKWSVAGILSSLLIFCVILLSYITTNRSTKVSVKPGSGINTNGIVLE